MSTRPTAKTAEAELAALRRQVEELERDRDLLNAIANHAPSLLCLVDADGSVRRGATNVAFERTLGYTPGEANSVVLWERFVPPEDADLTRKAILDVVAGRPYGEREGRWLTRARAARGLGCAPRSRCGRTQLVRELLGRRRVRNVIE